MKNYTKIILFVLAVLLAQVVLNYINKNHIDKYEVSLDALMTLPDGFYAPRGRNIYFSNDEYLIWLTRNKSGDVKNIFSVTNLEGRRVQDTILISKYKIDTVELKIVMQNFLNLKRKFKFGHISIDRANKIAFSSREGLLEEYVMVLNDSVKSIYTQNTHFRHLENGWFEYAER